MNTTWVVKRDITWPWLEAFPASFPTDIGKKKKSWQRFKKRPFRPAPPVYLGGSKRIYSRQRQKPHDNQMHAVPDLPSWKRERETEEGREISAGCDLAGLFTDKPWRSQCAKWNQRHVCFNAALLWNCTLWTHEFGRLVMALNHRVSAQERRQQRVVVKERREDIILMPELLLLRCALRLAKVVRQKNLTSATLFPSGNQEYFQEEGI